MSAAEGAPLLDVRHLQVELRTRRGTLVAVDDVSFTIAMGEVLGVVGESGAGKSLTGMAVIGLLDPPCHVAAGEIWLAGRRIDRLSGEEMRRVRGREIGTIFQDPLASLDPLHRIGDQLVETIRTHLVLTPRQARGRALDLLQEVGIASPEERLDQYPHQLSGGTRQRVVIALALCADPVLVIADECTTALDVSVQAQVLALLHRLCREHHTSVMLITHDMGVIAEMADRVAVMYAGRVVETGALEDVVLRARHPYTRGLMDAVPSVETAVERLAQIEGSMPRLEESPTGCAFHPRCSRADDRCRRERPGLARLGSSMVACWSPITPSVPPASIA
jgi:peptide/nickel transport system ATP-binding protein